MNDCGATPFVPTPFFLFFHWFRLTFEKQGGGNQGIPVEYDGMMDRKVLIIDADQKYRDTIHAYLKARNCVIRTAVGISEALDILQQSGPADFDLIIANDSTPHVTDKRLSRAIKAIDENSRPKLLFLVPYGLHQDSRQLRTQGIDLTLKKPLRQAKLLEAMVGFFGKTNDNASVDHHTEQKTNLPSQ